MSNEFTWTNQAIQRCAELFNLDRDMVGDTTIKEVAEHLGLPHPPSNITFEIIKTADRLWERDHRKANRLLIRRK